MSYLNIPRLHFTGQFQADPSTVNNNDANYDPTAQLSNQGANPDDPTNTSVYWNPHGTHNWKLVDCTVSGAANGKGQFTAPSQDPIIGAKVYSSGTYPAKLVDLDPDNQGVSQIWGLEIQISIPDPGNGGNVLASVTGVMPPTAFGDLWNRATNAPKPGMPTMCAAFQAVLQEVKWVNATASNLLAWLQKVSPNSLSIRFNVDSYQPDSNQANFTFGRVVGTIGPSLTGEAPRSTPRRLSPVQFWSQRPFIPQNLGNTPTIFSPYGPVGAVWDERRSVLILDLGNCVATDGTPPTSGPSVPIDGWPIVASSLRLTMSSSTSVSSMRLKSGGDEAGAGVGTPTLGEIRFDTNTYLTYAGIVEFPVSAAQARQLSSSPLTLFDDTASIPVIAAQEESQGRYVDVDVPFLRLNPRESRRVSLWATKFGRAWAGAELDVALVPQIGNALPPGSQPTPQANNGGPWPNGYPQNALTLSSNLVITGTDGVGGLVLTAADPGTPRTYPNGQAGPDGQVYWITGSWAEWGRIFLFPGGGITNPPNGTPINVLIFSSFPSPAQPNWDQHVGPLLANYARMYPYMKGIVDLADYDIVVANADAIEEVVSFRQP
jgi:hypothetical protein